MEDLEECFKSLLGDNTESISTNPIDSKVQPHEVRVLIYIHRYGPAKARVPCKITMALLNAFFLNMIYNNMCDFWKKNIFKFFFLTDHAQFGRGRSPVTQGWGIAAPGPWYLRLI